MNIDKNSNAYTIAYIVVLVLVVGFLLSLVYQALRPEQETNMANDKKRQILAAALIVPGEGESIASLYDSHIIATRVIDSRGMEVAGSTDAFNVNISEEIKKPDDRRLLPVYECKTESGLKYILPAYGAGLWGPIWGYVAMDADGKTIYGAYFAHQGETPGLGAEIEKPEFSNQFRGKTIYSDGKFEPVSVVKTGHEPSSGEYVYAKSGATITSQGVQKMLDNSLRPYDAFFTNLQNSKP